LKPSAPVRRLDALYGDKFFLTKTKFLTAHSLLAKALWRKQKKEGKRTSIDTTSKEKPNRQKPKQRKTRPRAFPLQLAQSQFHPLPFTPKTRKSLENGWISGTIIARYPTMSPYFLRKWATWIHRDKIATLWSMCCAENPHSTDRFNSRSPRKGMAVYLRQYVGYLSSPPDTISDPFLISVRPRRLLRPPVFPPLAPYAPLSIAAAHYMFHHAAGSQARDFSKDTVELMDGGF
jgi:hypothetical protein